MLSIENARHALQSSFSGNIERRFCEFVSDSNVDRFVIATDFALSDPERANDVFAFSVFPWGAELPDMFEEANAAASRDLKHIRSVSDKMIKFLRSSRRFHFLFVMPLNRHWDSTLLHARTSIDQTLERLEENGSSELLTKLQRMRQAAKAKKFNAELMADVFLTGLFVSFITYLLIKYSRPEGILWLPDRDAIIQFGDTVVGDLWMQNVAGLCDEENLDRVRTTRGIGHVEAGSNKSAGWFDDLVRVPDYLAGSMARWGLKNNRLSGKSQKQLQVIEKVLPDHDQMSVTLLSSTVFGYRASQLAVSADPKSDRLHGRAIDAKKEISFLARGSTIQASHSWTTLRKLLANSTSDLIRSNPQVNLWFCNRQRRGVLRSWRSVG